MKNARTAFLAIVTAALAVPALADTAASGVTREQVKAEYIRALKAGELDFAREFVSPAASARQNVNAASATKIEELSPTAAGSQAAASTVKTAN